MPTLVGTERLTIALSVLLLAACTTAPPQAPKVERISGEALEAQLPQPVSSISLADIVAMSRAGIAPEEIVKRIGAAHARYRLSATQLVELSGQGVALAVLDHLVETERRAIFDDLAADIARREQTCNERIAQEVRQCRLQAMPMLWPHPFATCWPPHPGLPYWRCF